MKINNTIAAFVAICGLLYGANSTMAADKSLLKAAQTGDTAAVQGLIDSGASVNGTNRRGYRPLHFAAGEGHEAAVRVLVRAGANVNVVNRGGFTPLHMCSHEEIVKVLIDAGADLNLCTRRGTPLERVLIMGNIASARILLHAGAELPDCEQFRGLATLAKTVEMALGFVNGHRESNANAGSSSLTVLHHAVGQAGSADKVKLLLEHGIDANAPDREGLSALDHAAGWQKKDIAKVLCERGADLPQLTVDILREQGMLEACRERSDARLRAIDALQETLPKDVVEQIILPFAITQSQIERLNEAIRTKPPIG